MFNLDLTWLFIFAFIGLVFGCWKLIEIVIWIFQHVHIAF